MGSRLRSAFEEAAKLPPDKQDAFAAFLLAELHDEQDWMVRFENSQDALSRLANEARREHRAGKTRPLEDLLS